MNSCFQALLTIATCVELRGCITSFLFLTLCLLDYLSEVCFQVFLAFFLSYSVVQLLFFFKQSLCRDMKIPRCHGFRYYPCKLGRGKPSRYGHIRAAVSSARSSLKRKKKRKGQDNFRNISRSGCQPPSCRVCRRKYLVY